MISALFAHNAQKLIALKRKEIFSTDLKEFYLKIIYLENLSFSALIFFFIEQKVLATFFSKIILIYLY